MYSKFSSDQLILRDLLARDRTVLANERTLLAYLRTALGFGAAGATLLQLFPNDAALLSLGIALCTLAILIFVGGIYRFISIANRLRQIAVPVDTPDGTLQQPSN